MSQPIVDAHQHFWDLERNYLPWLCDEPAIPFRYGDYGALRRNYLPADYFRDSARQNVVKTVHVETEWDPADPVGETRWLQEIIEASGFPHAIVAQARLDRDDVEAVLAGHAAFAQVRGIRHKPRAAEAPDRVERGAPGSMGDPQVAARLCAARPPRPLVRPADALVASRRGGGARARFPGHADHPEPHRPAVGSQRARACGLAARRCACLPNSRTSPARSRASGSPAGPGRSRATGRVVLDTIEIFGVDRCMFASNFPVDSLVADFDTIFDGFKTIVAGFSAAEQAALFHDNAHALLPPGPGVDLTWIAWAS